MLPTAALAWAPYEQASAAQEPVPTEQQQVAQYDPAMQPLDQTYAYEFQGDDNQSSTNMPLDAD